MTTKKAISTEMAVEELTVFLKKHKKKDFKRGRISEDDIKKDYIDAIEAIEDGFLVFKNGNPVYRLQEPLVNSEGATILKEVVFRSRVKQADKMMVMNGLNVSEESGTYLLKLMALGTQISIAEIKQLEKDDYKVLDQINSVF